MTGAPPAWPAGPVPQGPSPQAGPLPTGHPPATPPPSEEEGPIIALACEDLHEKEAVLASGAKGVFTIAHFDGYPAVLVALPAVSKRVFRQLVEDAWLSQAPPKAADAYLGNS